jgi:hypothetical protein
LIQQGVTGLLVPPADPARLAQAMTALIRDPTRRAALGAAGERRVRNIFAMKSGIDVLALRFGLCPVSLEGLRDASGPSCDTHRHGEDAVLQAAGVPFHEVRSET